MSNELLTLLGGVITGLLTYLTAKNKNQIEHSQFNASNNSSQLDKIFEQNEKNLAYLNDIIASLKQQLEMAEKEYDESVRLSNEKYDKLSEKYEELLSKYHELNAQYKLNQKELEISIKNALPIKEVQNKDVDEKLDDLQL